MCTHREHYYTKRSKTLKANVFIGYNNPHDFSQAKCFICRQKGVTLTHVCVYV